MSSVVLNPVADGSPSDSWYQNQAGVNANLYASLVDGNDSTFVFPVNSSASLLWLVLGTLPSDFNIATGVLISLRLQAGAVLKGAYGDWSTVQIFQSNQTTALTAQSAIADTTTTTNYTYTPTLSGVQTKAAWTNAQIAIGSVYTGGGVGQEIMEASVTITYTPTSSASRLLELRRKLLPQG